MMVFASVDLPEPLGPISACVSPLRTVRFSPRRISRSSMRTCRFWISRLMRLGSPCLPSRGLLPAYGRPSRIPARPFGSAPGCQQSQVVGQALGSDLSERIADPLDAFAVDQHDTRCVI